MRGVESVGSLRVDASLLDPMEVDSRVSRYLSALTALWSKRQRTGYLPILLDMSLESHLILLALSRLQINCALLDSSMPEGVLARYLEELGEHHAISRHDVEPLLGNKATDSDPTTTADAREDNVTPEGNTDGSVIIFTSGSSGHPKAVQFSWGTIHGILNDPVGKTRGEVILNLQPLHWTVGFFNTLSVGNGNSLISLNPMNYAPTVLLQEIAGSCPTRFYLGADFARSLGKALPHYRGPVIDRLSLFVVGAGTTRWEEIAQFSRLVPPDAEFLHSYGSSEAVGMMAFRCRFGDIPAAGQVPLGRPRQGGGVRFLPTEDPEVFEVIASLRIAEGYLDKNDTLEKFRPDETGTVWWHSGDLVRRDPSTAQYYFVGRRDDIVKVNDQRISLLGVEMGLRELAYVQDAAARIFEVEGRKRLIGYVQLTSDSPATRARFSESLRAELQRNNQPHAIVFCDEIPYTSRHKPDSARLFELAGESLGVPLTMGQLSS